MFTDRMKQCNKGYTLLGIISWKKLKGYLVLPLRSNTTSLTVSSVTFANIKFVSIGFDMYSVKYNSVDIP